MNKKLMKLFETTGGFDDTSASAVGITTVVAQGLLVPLVGLTFCDLFVTHSGIVSPFVWGHSSLGA